MSDQLEGLDELDLKIIAHLQEDGRMTFKDIAQDIGVTERTIRLRVNQLRESGILSIVGIVNPIKVGLKLIAAIQISVLQHSMEQCIEQLNALDEVRFIAITSGEYQLIIEVAFRSHEKLVEFIEKKLNNVAGIRKTNIIMELKIVKNEFRFVKE